MALGIAFYSIFFNTGAMLLISSSALLSLSALKEDISVVFQLRSVFIVKTFSFKCFETVTCWEKSHISQHDLHVLPIPFPYLPMVY